MRDVIHGEEARTRNGRRISHNPPQDARGRVSHSRSDVRIPGPFWIRQRPDERREVDVPRRRKFESTSYARDVIHGEGPSKAGMPCKEFSHSKRRARPSTSGTQIPGPFWMEERSDERREIDAPRRRKFQSYSEAKDVIHGEGSGSRRDEGRKRHPYDLPSRCRPSSNSRIPGPFWMNQRADERREPDVARRRKFEQRGDLPDIIHGEEARARERQEARDRQRENRPPINVYDLPPGPSHADPFWMLERQDERRDPDMDKKRKFGRQRIQTAEIIHGEDFRAKYDPQEEFLGMDDTDEMGDSDEDDSEPFPFKRTCRCGPAPPQSGPDRWMLERDWGGYDAQVEAEGHGIPTNVEEMIRQPPAARVSCAPQADVSNFDQPNAFMRKLYEKYPYLYQVLQETPPEELASRVFKDRFLSTYQVDFLHMGSGREGLQERGAQGETTQRYAGPDGEPEPEAIPGCSYRHSQKGDFGKKKHEEKEKKEKEETPVVQEEREEPRISEYMATISKLGNEIIQDQLYKIAQSTKNMKNQYKKM